MFRWFKGETKEVPTLHFGENKVFHVSNSEKIINIVLKTVANKFFG